MTRPRAAGHKVSPQLLVWRSPELLGQLAKYLRAAAVAGRRAGLCQYPCPTSWCCDGLRQSGPGSGRHKCTESFFVNYCINV
ncbi:hypothetical protein NDU88_003385 [Pleurodeles waltl]|uniref:Uncharacterized protein n=1 Tax=Pleurodeles waltl TaxID=8319 RepID=A0AAV7MRN3_PLEWA|nr:hypothetical protein NDU88_003385 [Pleurodeles waltl]